MGRRRRERERERGRGEERQRQGESERERESGRMRGRGRVIERVRECCSRFFSALNTSTDPAANAADAWFPLLVQQMSEVSVACATDGALGP